MGTATRYRNCTRSGPQETSPKVATGLSKRREVQGRVGGQKGAERGKAQVSVPLLPMTCCPLGPEAKGKFRGATA